MMDLSMIRWNEQGLVPAIAQIISPEFANELVSGSTLMHWVNQVDILKVGAMMKTLIGG